MNASMPTKNLNSDQSKDLPSWLSTSIFEAQTTLSEKVSRAVNTLIFVAVPFAIYALATGGTGTVAYCSYLAIGLAARKIVSVNVGYKVYPIALTGLIALVPFWGKKALKELGQKMIDESTKKISKWESLRKQNISLCKSGVRYDAYLVYSPDTIENGNWAIHALGNG